ncbi:MAG: glycosyltransferase family 9 protein [Planctomycetes bacterium]|nr:glycosyltransferase family 9 protein [Planctomycetota bacterium]
MSRSRILVFRPGQLGDTVVALPALHVIRQNWPAARIALLHDVHDGAGYPSAESVLKDSGLVDEFIPYRPAGSLPGRLTKAMGLLLKIRPKRFDTFVYLAPAIRSPRQRKRDVRMAHLWGIESVIGDVDFPAPGTGIPRGSNCPFEADVLLQRLSYSGLAVPAPNSGCMDLGLGAGEIEGAKRWARALGIAPGRRLVAVAPGSKMPAKRWPVERFVSTVAGLIAACDVWPVVFGGPEDAEAGTAMVKQWGRGSICAGTMSVRQSAAARAHCRLFLGNDAGTMHLAAAVGVPCVAIFSARDTRGTWYPYGPQGHVVFREEIECEGCMLTVCKERDNECLKRVDVPRVEAACRAILSKPTSPGAAC